MAHLNMPGVAKVVWYTIDMRRNELKLMAKPPMPFAGNAPAPRLPNEPPLRVKLTTGEAKEAETAEPVTQLWLESLQKSEKPRVLISGDCSGGRLLRDNLVVFSSQGALYATPLLRLSKQEYARMQQAAKRAVLLSHAKQLGLGLIMYAQDNEETFPDKDGINAKIDPYLKDPSLFDGFSYTYGGGSLADIEKPAETVLGYVQGAGGRAIIYADGHIRWKDD